MIGPDRRRFMTGASSLAAGIALSGCGDPSRSASGPGPEGPILSQTPLDEAITDDLVEAFLAESYLSSDSAGAGGDRVTSWAELENNPDLVSRAKSVLEDIRDGALKAAPVDDGLSVDYLQLASPDFGADGRYSDALFRLDDALMRSVALANGYQAILDDPARPVVVFGLRGCILPDGETASRKGEVIEVREAVFDHVRRRCLVGVWNTATGAIEAYSGSTVPNLANIQFALFSEAAAQGVVEAGADFRKMQTCMLPQGLYAYDVGIHLPRAERRRQQPGSLVQVSDTPVLRAFTDLRFSVEDSWDPLDWRPAGAPKESRIVGANIHAGVNKGLPSYSSQGCQTIFGWYEEPDEPTQHWAMFQASLGITLAESSDGAIRSSLDGQRFHYLLSSGREARLHSVAAGDPERLAALRRLRLGSRGPEALALRKFLGRSQSTDVIDGGTVLAFLRWQAENDRLRDGVLTPRLSADFAIGAF